MRPSRPQRLPHSVPWWVAAGSSYFVTLCAEPRGTNQLCCDGVAAGLWESIQVRQAQGAWWVHLWLLMPDHTHAILVPSPEPGLKHTLAAWKRYTARQLGVVWQRDWFEHRLRNDESLAAKAEYIRENPVRAGLVGEAAAWPYVWPRNTSHEDYPR